VVEGDEVVCPRHGARFCIKTGAALTAPAYEPVVTFPVRVQDGVIQVQDNRWD
jgi:3-phenylpropionate/trans-cinnamate dioxygenase ferredoxin subunit